VLKLLGKHKKLIVFPLLVGLIGVFSIGVVLVVDVEFVCAHSPHDVINALDISPAYPQDKTLFIISEKHLLKSTDGGGTWKKLAKGLDNKYQLSSIAISPNFDPDQTVFASSEGDGIYKSQDGGASWAKINDGLENLRINLLAISPRYNNDEIVLAAGVEGGLYRTDAGGENWDEVIGQEIKITAIAFSPDPGQDLIVIGDDESWVWFSKNGGETWQKHYQIPQGGTITAIAISDQLSKDGTFFVGTAQQGVFKTVDGGVSFIGLKRGPSRFSLDRESRYIKIRPPDQHITSLALLPDYGRNETIFASTWYDAAFRSDDGGRTWRRYNAGVTCDDQANSIEYKSPHFTHLRVSNGFEEDGILFLAGFDGLFKSIDKGQTWTQLETLPIGLITGMDISPADENDFLVTIATYGGGAYTINNQGVNWKIKNSGLKTTRLVDVTFSPAYSSDNTVFSGAKNTLLKSTNGTDDWDAIGLPKIEGLGTPYPTFIVLSPNFATDQTLYFATRRHGILKSIDGGLNSSIVWDGTGKLVNTLIMSPNFLADGTLFASVWGKGVYKTEDGGRTWQPVNHGLTFLETWKSSTTSEVNSQNILLVISPDYKEDKTLFAGSAGAEGLFKTIDGGISWQKLAGTAFGSDGKIIGLAISPDYKNEQTLIISVKGKGLFKTGDGGLTFVKIGDELIDNNHTIELIEFSPLYSTDNTIYAASLENTFRSIDGGDTWELLSRPVRYEDMREVVHYEGEWLKEEGPDFSATSVTQSSVADSTASLSFVGTGVSWIGTEGQDQGMAKVYVDGGYVEDVDQFNDISKSMITSFSITGLDYGWHTIMIQVTGTKNLLSTGYRVAIDAFDVEP
jgi:photosystem II stability/assembly factor-like uncharacterized protein